MDKRWWILGLIFMGAIIVLAYRYQNNFINNNEKDCDELGGEWMKKGISGEDFCNMRAEDFGKECIDSEECEGRCIADEGNGMCSEFEEVYGCHSFVEDGNVTERICID